MIRRADAVRYDRRAENGRTEPLRVAVETGDGEEHEVFLKTSAAPQLSVDGLCCEFVAAWIAGLLGLPVCEPFLVEISQEWIASVQDAPLRAVLNAGASVAFGSKAAGAGWRPWLSSDQVTMARRETARDILVFDALTENPDRRPGNPNLLVRGDAFRIIDHEMSLRVALLLPRPTPWRVGGLSWLAGPERHVFAQAFKGVTALDLLPLEAVWSDLTDEALNQCAAAVPDEWSAGANAVTAALTHVKTVRDNIGSCLQELQRALG